ncbi:MAG: ABC transporter permease subunit [Methylococcaceae bacterium]|nr:ABC transporter permease subunit [Methylococcaceae bacterium]MDZ4157592.1 ABC transporter permease subunit [Methylococcales bacterium]MDP2393156.1 ABC transporter permease subunit [Methylococcaceae bacterium]MDP3019300.1 ABC transporter permease subunit [Methylococcaceae bacterium]MDP3389120.1 ABC transporter permease subunit [Methylococcaceae bacterium]
MPEINKNTKKPASIQISPAYEQWRLLKDKLARYGVVAGGLGVIVAIVLIFFYLLYVVYPLFISASVEPVDHYAAPEQALGKTILLEMEEQNEVAARFTESGQVVFFEVATGKVVLTQAIAIPEGVKITSFSQGSPINEGAVIYGLSDGRAIVVKHQYKATYPDNKRLITPSLKYPLGETPLVIDTTGAALEKIAVKIGSDASTVIVKSAGKIRLVNFAKEQSLFADEAALTRTDAVLEVSAENVETILVDKDEANLYLLSADGRLSYIDISNKSSPLLRQEQNVVTAGQTITSVSFLNGDLSLLIGDSTGQVSQWSMIRDKLNHRTMEKIRAFKVSDKAVVTINAEQRRKGFMAIDADGVLGIYHSTAERQLIKQQIGQAQPVAAVLSPRANGLLVELADGQMHFWRVDNEHPEVSIKSLWQEVWYESYPKPDYIWQSSSASNDFEPKYSLTPLVFGTLKAAFYAMWVAIPLALMGAIYTAYFMAPGMRIYVKPTIEIMGALPTVILGFLAGLWLAPFMEAHLGGVFALLMILPLGVMLFAYAWLHLPKKLAQKIPEGWGAAFLIPVILLSGWFAFSVSVPLETWLFNGSLRDWFKSELGIGYDQRNALVVGVAMGFAVIPTIFSIAEDAIFSVPKHLTVGSLALGATPWQTMSRVVLLTASPGIFSAVMIGFGRAVGETMIVLMATGNTPVMDLSVFQGLRTLAANIAVEMPESEVDSTHYRILFLAALVLFVFTFIFNTLAEVIRQRLREKYSSL